MTNFKTTAFIFALSVLSVAAPQSYAEELEVETNTATIVVDCPDEPVKAGLSAEDLSALRDMMREEIREASLGYKTKEAAKDVWDGTTDLTSSAWKTVSAKTKYGWNTTSTTVTGLVAKLID